MNVANSTKISEKYQVAEQALQEKHYQVKRLVRDGQVDGLQVYGQMFQDLAAVREILFWQFPTLVLNSNYQTITIKFK